MSDAASAPDRSPLLEELRALAKTRRDDWVLNDAIRLCDSQALALTQQQQEIARLARVVELKQAAIDRLAICPDHQGKAGGERCYVCKAVESARREVTAERDALKQQVEDWERLYNQLLIDSAAGR